MTRPLHAAPLRAHRRLLASIERGTHTKHTRRTLDECLGAGWLAEDGDGYRVTAQGIYALARRGGR